MPADDTYDGQKAEKRLTPQEALGIKEPLKPPTPFTQRHMRFTPNGTENAVENTSEARKYLAKMAEHQAALAGVPFARQAGDDEKKFKRHPRSSYPRGNKDKGDDFER